MPQRFKDLDPMQKHDDYPEFWDDIDVDHKRRLPYRPFHPLLEGFTAGILTTLIAGFLVWFIIRMFIG